MPRTIKNALSLLFIFVLLALGGCREVVLHELSEEQANRARLLLSDHNITTEKTYTGSAWNLAVSNSEIPNALRILEENRLLPRKSSRQEKVSSSFVLSKEERLMLRERQISNSLEDTLLRIPGVLEARVHLFLEAHSSFAMKAKANSESASVLMVMGKGEEIDPHLVKSLVAGASGIGAKQISVLISRKVTKANATASESEEVVVGSGKRETNVRFTETSISGIYRIAIPILIALFLISMFLKSKREKTIKTPTTQTSTSEGLTLNPPPEKRANGELWQEEVY